MARNGLRPLSFWGALMLVGTGFFVSGAAYLLLVLVVRINQLYGATLWLVVWALYLSTVAVLALSQRASFKCRCGKPAVITALYGGGMMEGASRGFFCRSSCTRYLLSDTESVESWVGRSRAMARIVGGVILLYFVATVTIEALGYDDTVLQQWRGLGACRT